MILLEALNLPTKQLGDVLLKVAIMIFRYTLTGLECDLEIACRKEVSIPFHISSGCHSKDSVV